MDYEYADEEDQLLISEDEINKEIKYINNMSHKAMVEFLKAVPIEHIYFNMRLPFYRVFRTRFNEFGGYGAYIDNQRKKEV